MCALYNSVYVVKLVPDWERARSQSDPVFSGGHTQTNDSTPNGWQVPPPKHGKELQDDILTGPNSSGPETEATLAAFAKKFYIFSGRNLKFKKTYQHKIGDLNLLQNHPNNCTRQIGNRCWPPIGIGCHQRKIHPGIRGRGRLRPSVSRRAA